MFDLKYFDKIRREVKEFDEKTDSLLNPKNIKKIQHEIKFKDKKSQVSHILSLCPDSDRVINRQIIYKLYGQMSIVRGEEIIEKLSKNYNTSK